MSVAELAAQLRVPAGVVNEFMIMFTELKLVLPLADEDTFVLGRDPATITIKAIIDCVRSSGKSVKVQGQRGKEEVVIDDILLAVEQAAAEALEGKNLQALLLSLDPPQGRR
jgi:DNA-binding IscR family transcriptional regulator